MHAAGQTERRIAEAAIRFTAELTAAAIDVRDRPSEQGPRVVRVCVRVVPDEDEAALQEEHTSLYPNGSPELYAAIAALIQELVALHTPDALRRLRQWEN